MRKNWVNLLAKNYDKVDTTAATASVDSIGYSAEKSSKTMETLDKKIIGFNNTIKEMYISTGDSGLSQQLKGFVEIGTVLAKVGAWAAPFLLTLGEVSLALAGISATMKIIKAQSLTQSLDKLNLSGLQMAADLGGMKGVSFNAGTTSATVYDAAVRSLQKDIMAKNITEEQSVAILSAVSSKMGLSSMNTNTLAAAQSALKAKVDAGVITQEVMNARMDELTLSTAGATLAANEKASADAALNEMQVVTAASAKGLQLAMVGLTLGITAILMIGIPLIQWMTQADERQQKLLSNGADLAKKYQEESKSISDLVTSYQELSASGATDSETKKQLLDIQTKLISSYGGEADGLDLVNGKYKEQIKILQDASKEKAADYVRSYQKEFNNANNVLKNTDATAITTSAESKSNPTDVTELEKIIRATKGVEQVAGQVYGVNGDLQTRVNILKSILDESDKIKNKSEDQKTVIGLISGNYHKLNDELTGAKSTTDQMFSAQLVSEYSDKLGEITKAATNYEKATATGNTKDIQTSEADITKLSTAMNNTLSQSPELKQAFQDWVTGLNLTSKASKEVTTEIGLSKDALATLTTAFDTSVSSISSYNKLMEDYKTNGKFSAESVQEIIDKHQDLAGYLQDEPMLYMKMSEALETEKNTANSTYGQMMASNDAYYSNNIKGTDKVKKALGEYYNTLSDDQKTDLENSKNLAEAKLKIEKSMVETLAALWSSYYTAETEALYNVPEYQQQDAVKNDSATSEIQKKIDALNAVTTNFDNISANITAPGIDKAGASTKADTSATDALTAATKKATAESKVYEDALKSLDDTMKANENTLTNAAHGTQEYIDGLTKKAALITQEIALNKQSIIVNTANAKSLALLADAAAKASGSTSGGGSSSGSSGSYSGKYSSWINDAASQNGLSPALIAGIIQTESSFNPNSVNSKSGATGLGQFLASTAKEIGLKDRTDPQSSIYALASYLKTRINQAGSTNGGIMGYGEGTQDYLNKVLSNASSFGYSGGSSSGSSSGGLSISEIQKIVGANVDGIMGAQTKAAIKAWQKAHGLTADGIVGVQTTAAMGGGSSLGGSTGSVDTSGADGLMSKVEEATAKIADLQQQLLEIPYLKFEDHLTGYDNRVAIITNKLSILKNDMELSTSGVDQANISMQITASLKEEVAIAKEKEAYINQEIASRTYTAAQVADMNTKLLDVKETESSITLEIKQQADAQIAVVTSAESKVMEILRKTNEERKKLITDRYDLENKKLDELQAKYSADNTTDDYNKNLGKEQAAMNAIDASITSAQRDKSSASGQARLAQLMLDKKAEQDKIDEMTLARGRDINNAAFDKAKTDLAAKQAAELAANDATYSDEEITKMAKDAVLSGLIRDVEGNVITLSAAYTDFENRFGSGMSAMGQSVKDNLIASLTEAQALITAMQANGTINLSANVPVQGSHAKGGIIDYTGLGYLHGSKENPEVAFNGKQAVNLLNSMATTQMSLPNYQLPNLSFPSMNMPNANSSNGSSSPVIHFDQPLVLVQGNADQNTVRDLEKLGTKWKGEITKSIMDGIGYSNQ